MAAPPTLEIISHFQQQGEFLEAMPYGTGHINDTFASRFRTDRGVVRYIHQRINQHVFREPEQVMENIAAVLSAAGTDFGSVIKSTIFLVDMNDFASVNEVYGRCFETHKPARSTVAVKALPRGALVEIDVIAGCE
jgi:reactive intermediate/imine deaminase